MTELGRKALASYAEMRWASLSQSGVEACKVELDLVHGVTDTYRASLRLDDSLTVREFDQDPYLAIGHAFNSAIRLVGEPRLLA